MNKIPIFVLGSLGLLGFACGTERLYVGSKGSGADAGVPVGVPWSGKPSNSFDQPCAFPAPEFVAGTWQGELDSYALPSGSKSIRIEVTGAYQSADGLCGKVTFGSGAPPPIATDPAAAPAGAPLDTLFIVGKAPIEGMPYEFYASELQQLDLGDAGAKLLGQAPAIEGQRIRFGITLTQSYKSWCNLQLAYRESGASPGSLFGLSLPSAYGCMPPNALSSAPGGVHCDSGNLAGVTIHGASCAQAEFCLFGPCWCVDQGGVPPTTGCTILYAAATRFDLTVAGSTLTGGVALAQSVETMHLTRSP